MVHPLSVSIHRGIGYEEALAWQMEALEQLKLDETAAERLFVVEHKPVITLGRSGDGSSLLSDTEALKAAGIEFHEARRGGDVTYHGPGQWTLYPILRMDHIGRDLHKYMRRLEDVTIDFLRGFDLEGIRVEGKTGVWLKEPALAKITAVGVAVSRWITFHGTAINIQPDLSIFRKFMVPCGIAAAEGGVTSLKELLQQDLDMMEMAEKLIASFCRVFPYERGSIHGFHG